MVAKEAEKRLTEAKESGVSPTQLRCEISNNFTHHTARGSCGVIERQKLPAKCFRRSRQEEEERAKENGTSEATIMIRSVKNPRKL